jgi:hypothetical protein
LSIIHGSSKELINLDFRLIFFLSSIDRGMMEVCRNQVGFFFFIRMIGRDLWF